jgi:hypothetical protein
VLDENNNQAAGTFSSGALNLQGNLCVLAALGKALLLIILLLSVSAIVGTYLSSSPNSDGVRLIASVACAAWAIAIVSMAVKAAWRLNGIPRIAPDLMFFLCGTLCTPFP